MANLIGKIFSFGADARLKSYTKKLQGVSALEAAFESKTDEELRSLADALRERAAAGEPLDSLMPEAFALVRETSARVTGLRHYDVQLIGAMALHDGCVAEMKTGEGKTLVSTAAGFLNALSGKGVHVVTVNDYLARRDAEWMGGIYGALGMEVGLIQADMRPEQRRAAYAADVTYGTNAQLGFDYLKDNLVGSAAERVHRGHHFAIVDEADSILIDEARTPLVISGPGERAAELYQRFAELAPKLDEESHVAVDEAKRLIYPTEEGLDLIEELLGEEIYADASGRMANHLRQALRAQFLYKRDVDYIVKDGKVMIVDEFTGRIMQGRRYSEGLHQAIEAKEGVEVLRESMTMATITLQNYFRLYEKLSGMTGTALTEDTEFESTYHMPVVAIPTNKPVARTDHPDYLFRTADAKFKAVADEVALRHAKGQPVLVGTASVKNSERLSAILKEREIPHSVLNAKNHEEEARIVAQAGREGAVTISTNMAGRGTDIILGGNFQMLKEDHLVSLQRWNGRTEDWMDGSAEDHARYITSNEGYSTRVLGGLCVIGTERHDARRIDDQLRGRAGRQGDPGESRFYLSLEDDLLTQFGGDRLQTVAEMMEKQGLGDEVPFEDALADKVVNVAQRQIESLHFLQRKHLLDFDDVLNRQRAAVYRERNAILEGKDPSELLDGIIDDCVGAAVSFCCPSGDPSDDWDLSSLSAWTADMTGRDSSFVAEVDHGEDPDELVRAIGDFMRGILEEKRAVLGDEGIHAVGSRVLLQVMDAKWLAHLHEMERLRQGIMLRAVGRREPLLEYKDESYEAFEAMAEGMYEDFLRMMLRAQVAEPQPAQQPEEGAFEVDVAEDGGAPADFSPVVDNPLG